jgi:hypothetical protein
MEHITHRAFRSAPHIPSQRPPRPDTDADQDSRAIVFDVREARRLADLLRRAIEAAEG